MISKCISLIGPRGVGKTTIGKELAKKLGWKVIELDDLLDKKLSGGIEGFTKKYGWEEFRKKEYKILQNIFGKNHKNLILITGGGTAASEHEFSKHNVKLLKKKTTLVLLLPSKSKKKSLDVLFQRERKRFFFKTWSDKKLKEKVKNDFELRVPQLKKVSDVEIHTEERGVHEIIEAIVKKLKLKLPE